MDMDAFKQSLTNASPKTGFFQQQQEDPADFLSRFKPATPVTMGVAASQPASNDLDKDFIESLNRFQSDGSAPIEEKKTASSSGGVWTILAGFWSWKAMLVVGILTLLIWYVYPMLSSMKSMIQSMNELLNLSADIVEEPEKPEEEKPKAKKKTASPEPDESTSSVQGGAVNGFCLAGEWKGVRSCVGVPKGQACVSGQLFPTKEQCVNPTLR